MIHGFDKDSVEDDDNAIDDEDEFSSTTCDSDVVSEEVMGNTEISRIPCLRHTYYENRFVSPTLNYKNENQSSSLCMERMLTLSTIQLNDIKVK